MVGSPHFPSATDIRTRWNVRQRKALPLSARQSERVVGDVASAVLGARARTEDRRVWRSKTRRPSSMFDHCEITMALLGDDDDATSIVDVEVVFDVSPTRVMLIAGLATSLVGIPFGAAWRWSSVRSARSEARSIIESIGVALDGSFPKQPRVYR